MEFGLGVFHHLFAYSRTYLYPWIKHKVQYMILGPCPYTSFFVTLSLTALTPNSKSTLNLNTPFLAKSYDGFSEDSLLVGTNFV